MGSTEYSFTYENMKIFEMRSKITFANWAIDYAESVIVLNIEQIKLT